MAYSFSPSSLSLLKDCPRCFWLQFNRGIKRPSGIFPSLPSGMDRILKEHFDSFMEKDGLPPELKQLSGEAKLFSDVVRLDEWRNWRKGLRWEDGEGNVLTGALDNVLQKGKKLIVLDYKTRGFPLKEDTHEHYQDQLDIYNFLLRKNGYMTEDYAYLLFYHPTRVTEKGDVVFHKDLVRVDVDAKNAEKILRKALDVLRGEMPDHADGCGYCEWADRLSNSSGK
jgi:hypothetical protein